MSEQKMPSVDETARETVCDIMGKLPQDGMVEECDIDEALSILSSYTEQVVRALAAHFSGAISPDIILNAARHLGLIK